MVARHEEIERSSATPGVGGPPGGAAMRHDAAARAIASVAHRRHTMSELPPANVTRWTIRRKAAVVTAVAAGQITLEEVYRRYQISPEEFLSWQRAYEAFGLPGLRSTRLQQYRRTAPPSGPGRRR